MACVLACVLPFLCRPAMRCDTFTFGAVQVVRVTLAKEREAAQAPAAGASAGGRHGHGGGRNANAGAAGWHDGRRRKEGGG